MARAWRLLGSSWLLTAALALLAAALLPRAEAAATELALLSMRNDVTQGARAPGGVIHEVMIVVRQQKLSELESLVMDISDPFSPRYGNWLSRKEVAEMTVEKGVPETILQALKDESLCGGELVSAVVESFGDYIIARAPVRTWERVLRTEFYHFDRKDLFTNKALKPVIRALEYTIPDSLVNLVSSIQNTVQFPGRSKPQWNSPTIEMEHMAARAGNPDLKCNSHKFDNLMPPKPIKSIMSGFVTPELINTYYNIPLGSNKGSAKASQAMYESDGQNYSPADLLMFQDKFHLWNKTKVTDYGKHNVSKVCEKPPSPCGEADLDIQYMMAVSQITPTSYISQNANSSYAEDFWMVIFLRTLMNMTSPPLVNSVSYGSQEYEQSLSSILAFEEAGMKLAAMGVTVVISAGDDGAHDTAARASAMGAEKCGYSASYPATSKWVVAVGAVQGPESTAIIGANWTASASLPPTVCSGSAGGVITGGGGFSNYITAPSWQRNAVDAYFNNLQAWQMPAPGYNRSGRAYPDVSLLGYNYIVYQNKTAEGVSGTSASAPTFAAMVSLVNAARRDLNLPSVGFISKIIWEQHRAQFDPASVYDVKAGHNKCTATSGSSNVSDTCQAALITTCCTQGYYATAGWDPASGWGGLDFSKFKAYFLTLKMPTLYPTRSPTARPTNPTAHPTPAPTHPTAAPTEHPTRPTALPTLVPTPRPSTRRPSRIPTPAPTLWPSHEPTRRPTPLPGAPTFEPTALATPRPSSRPTEAPTRPTALPTLKPSERPSEVPTERPTPAPSAGPTVPPGTPSEKPTARPTAPSAAPTPVPSEHPSTAPSPAPSAKPTEVPTRDPTAKPSPSPTAVPGAPTDKPSTRPTPAPSALPTAAPTAPHVRRRRLSAENSDSSARVPTESIKLHGRADLDLRGRADPNAEHEVAVSLRLANLARLDQLHADVFDPEGDRYLQYPAPGDVLNLVADADNEAGVIAALTAAGVTKMKTSVYRTHIFATAPVALWEQLLDTQFFVVERRDENGAVLQLGRPLLRARQYFMPASLQPFAKAVLNTVQLPPAVTHRYRRHNIGTFSTVSDAVPKRSRRKASEKNTGATESPSISATGVCQSVGGEPFCVVNGEILVSPFMLDSVYSIESNVGYPCLVMPNGQPIPTMPYSYCPLQPFNRTFGQAIFASLGQYYSTEDLVLYEKDTQVPINLVYSDYGGHNYTMTLMPDGSQIDICAVQGGMCGEANLDVQLMMSMSQYTPTTFMYQNSTSTMFIDFLKFVDSFTVAKGQVVPWVISISYGGSEGSYSSVELEDFEVQAKLVALKGVTIIVASGDDGANGMYARTNNEGQYACGYEPDWPASSPSVTAVGALMGPEQGYAEVVCQSNAAGGITTSGGFSGHHASPSWQVPYVNKYFSTINPWQVPYPGYNRQGRGYPDVAVLGRSYLVYVGESATVEDGTSASAPVFASMISLINAQRAKMLIPLPPLGFINPFLYKYAAHFQYDVTQGDNRCSESSRTLLSGYAPGTTIAPMGSQYLSAAGCCEQGFFAAPGWDPVSGIGSVNFTSLAAFINSEFSVRYRLDRELKEKLEMGGAAADLGETTPGLKVQPLTAEVLAKSAAEAAAAEQAEAQGEPQPHSRANIASRSDLALLHRAPPQTMHTLVIVMAEQRLDELEAVLQEVGDPESREFGKHWTRQQVAEFTRLPADAQGVAAVDKVKQALLAAGAVSVESTTHGEIVRAQGTIETWEKLLQTQFYVYEVRDRDGSVSLLTVRCHEYYMPAALAGLAAHIFKTVQFPMQYFTSSRVNLDATRTALARVQETVRESIKGVGGVNVTSAIMKGYVTPKLLAEYYNVGSTDAQNFGSVAIFEGLNQSLSLQDLANFQKQFGLQPQTITPSHDIGGHTNKTCKVNPNNCGEANLDVQYMTALVHNIELFYIYSADFMDGLLEILFASTVLPTVLSISYGGPEKGTAPEDMQYFCQSAMKLGLTGVTIVVSSGDDGAPGTITRPMEMGPAGCTYTAQFPTSCPYVVSVGASMGPETGLPEVACQGNAGGSVTSGGGFSTTYPMPPWQVGAIQNYGSQWAGNNALYPWAAPVNGFGINPFLVTTMPSNTVSVGRGYPDVSMLGFNYLVVLGGDFTPVSGTSASAPVFAAMVALANARRLAKGKSSLGWLTKALYSPRVQTAGFLRDLTYGNNKCGAASQMPTLPPGSLLTTATCCSQGFTAVPGWDPVTGLGGLRDFEAFAAYFEQYTLEPTTMPSQTPYSPTSAPSPATFESLFLEPFNTLSGGAIFGILLAVLFPLAVAGAFAYMWWIGTLRNVSLASFKSWDSFASLFRPPSSPYFQENADEIPNPIVRPTTTTRGVSLVQHGGARVSGVDDVEMRASSFAESRESSFLGAGSFDSPQNYPKRL